MTENNLFVEGDDWEADFESHARWQLTAALAATPAQRLAWLEEMKVLACRSGALPRWERPRSNQLSDGAATTER